MDHIMTFYHILGNFIGISFAWLSLFHQFQSLIIKALYKYDYDFKYWTNEVSMKLKRIL